MNGAEFGFGMLTKAADIAANFGITSINNSAASQQARESRWENYLYNEMAARNADSRTRQLYNDLYSPQAKMKQLKEAGMSPSVAAAGAAGGAAGATAGAQGGGAVGPMSQTFGMPPASIMEIANAGLANAEARKANAEADELEGKNASGIAKIKNMLAQAGLYTAEEALTKTEDDLKELELRFNEETFDKNKEIITQTLNKLTADADKAFFDAKIANVNWRIKEATEQTEINTINAQFNKLIADTQLTKLQSNLTAKECIKIREETKKIKNDITNDNKRLLLETKDTGRRILDSRKMREKTDEEMKEIRARIKQRWTEIGIHATDVVLDFIAALVMAFSKTSALSLLTL